MRTRPTVFYLTRAAQGIFVSLFLIIVLFVPRRGEIVGHMLLYETMPDYRIETQMKEFLGLVPRADAVAVFLQDNAYADEKIPDNLEADVIISLPAGEEIDLIGIMHDIYQTDEKTEPAEHTYGETPIELDLTAINGFDDLKRAFYTVDPRTNMTSADFNIDEFMKADLSINSRSDGPKVLVFHTHSEEVFSDSKDESEGVMGLGRELCRILQEKYGVSALHDTTRHGLANDGTPQILGAYERMEPNVQKILKENPSIELVIDLHRDGVKGDKRFVTVVNGKPTAQIMFVNGLSKIYRNGTLMSIDSLPNPNRRTNLALSFRAQIEGNKLFPGLMRKTYLHAYRYSLHMAPKSMLIEIGAQTNTKAEAWNALEPLADILASVVLK